MMKKMIQWMMAAILICGATVFTACSSDDDKNDSKPTKKGLYINNGKKRVIK